MWLSFFKNIEIGNCDQREDEKLNILETTTDEKFGVRGK